VHFAEKNFDRKVPPAADLDADDRSFLAQFQAIADQVAGCYEKFRFRDGVTATMNLARAANKYFNDREPWKTIKTDPKICENTINCSLQAAYALAVLIEPVLPFTADKLRLLLNVTDPNALAWDAVSHWRLPDGHPLGEKVFLFEKIDDAVIEEETAKLGRLTAEPLCNIPPVKDQITIDDVMKLDLRVGKVIEAENVPKSNKLLKLKVDIGLEQRQLVAGIATQYAPGDLIGKQIIVVANLKPAKLFGVESQGMILAASTDEAGPVIVAPIVEIPEGAIVK